MPGYGPDRILQIYMRTLAGEFVSCGDWEERARAVVTPEAFGYVAGSAGGEDTCRANREALYQWRLRPRMLVDVANRDLSVEVLGTRFAAPFALAPVGVLGILHEEADRAVARAAAATGTPFVLSTVASTPIEVVAAEAGDCPRWFQLYTCRDPEINASLVRRAEAAGYSALVVTLDTTNIGFRERDLRIAYLPFLTGHGLANYFTDPVFRSRLPATPEENPEAAISLFADIFSYPELSWRDINTIRDSTRLPVLLKGIVHPDDARLAIDRGIDGLIVSNHGGRQIDGGVAAIDALAEIAGATDTRIPLLMDSGIRRAADIMKALALGASAVLIGRPYAYALGAAGEAGVTDLIRTLIAEFDLQLALSGCTSPRDIDRSMIVRAGS